MQFREHRGSLDEAMKTKVILKDRSDLLEHCKSIPALFGRTFDPAALKVEPYGGPDDRIGWSATYIVTIEGCAIGFTDSAY